MAHAPDIDLPEHPAAEDEKKKTEGPPVIMPFRLSLRPEEIFVWVVFIDVAFHTILLCLFHIRLAGIGSGVEGQKKSSHQKDSQ